MSSIITYQAAEVLSALGNCGILSIWDAENNFQLSKRTLRLLIEEDYLTSRTVLVQSSVRKVLLPGDKFKKWLSEFSFVPEIYTSNQRKYEHDLVLSSYYSNLTSEERRSYLNENAIGTYIASQKKELLNTANKIDAIFRRGTQKIAVEAITTNYSRDIIKQKHEFAKALECDSIIILKYGGL